MATFKNSLCNQYYSCDTCLLTREECRRLTKEYQAQAEAEAEIEFEWEAAMEVEAQKEAKNV